MTDKIQKYLGVKFFVKEPHVFAYEEMDGIDMDEYDYFCIARIVENVNNNGYIELDIYTDGEIKILEVGSWKVLPVVKLPFNWTCYKVELDVFDKRGQSHTFKGIPNTTSLHKRTSIVDELEWAINKIIGLRYAESLEHALAIEDLEKATNLAENLHHEIFNSGIGILLRIYELIKSVEKAIRTLDISKENRSKLEKGIMNVKNIIAGRGERR